MTFFLNRVQSSIPLSIFQEFVTALEGNSMKITSTNSPGLQRLCEEFGFDDLAEKLRKFRETKESSQEEQICVSLAGVRSAHLRESFEFIVNGSVIESDFAEAASIFPEVREHLSVDGCARKCFFFFFFLFFFFFGKERN
jgi:hypothetical protein